MFILVCEDKLKWTNLILQKFICTIYLYEGIIFRSSPFFKKKCVLQICGKFTLEYPNPDRNVISKEFCSTSAWVFYCKFAADWQNIFLEEHLWGQLLFFISFVLAQVISNTFYWLVAFIIYRPEFLDWSKPFWRFSLFYDVFL